MSLERLKDDPRLVMMEHNGHEYHFWYHRRCIDLAKNHGYSYEDSQSEESDWYESSMRFLWMCHLPFDRDLSFEDFDLLFTPADFPKLVKLAEEITEKQLPKVEEGPVDEVADEGKKPARRAKKK